MEKQLSSEEKTRIAAEKNKRRLEKLAALSPEEAEKLRLHNERIAKREADKKDRLRAKKARANEAKWEAQESKSEKRKSKPKETAEPSAKKAKKTEGPSKFELSVAEHAATAADRTKALGHALMSTDVAAPSTSPSTTESANGGGDSGDGSGGDDPGSITLGHQIASYLRGITEGEAPLKDVR